MIKIAMLIPYFGTFPEWTPFFVESIRSNPSVDFYFFCDTPPPLDAPPNNLHVQTLPFPDYCKQVSSALGIKFNPTNGYKLCDIKPCLGKIHEDIIKDYDYFGFCDIDLIFGDILSHLSLHEIHKYELFSTRETHISGPFALFKNNDKNRNFYTRIPDWRNVLELSDYVGIDEGRFKRAYRDQTFFRLCRKINNFTITSNIAKKLGNRFLSISEHLFYKKYLFRELYTTPFSRIKWRDSQLPADHPNTWYYYKGRIYNSSDGSNDCIYFHFVNFKSSRYRRDDKDAPWPSKEQLYHCSEKAMNDGIRIDGEGFHELSSDDLKYLNT